MGNIRGHGWEKDIFNGHNTFDKVEIWNILNRKMPIDIYIIAFYMISGLKDENICIIRELIYR